SVFFFFFSSRRRHTRFSRDWSSDVCSSDLPQTPSQARRRSVELPEWVSHQCRSPDRRPCAAPSFSSRRGDGDRMSSPESTAAGQIGRASCRERVEKPTSGGTGKKKQNNNGK